MQQQQHIRASFPLIKQSVYCCVVDGILHASPCASVKESQLDSERERAREI